MANTTNWSITYPTTANTITPLATHFANLANSTDTALTNVQKSGAPPVASATARNALFPSPVQGNRVYRTDLGYEEAYYGLYNSGSNPGGAITAGWYPVPGSDIRANVAKTNGFQAVTNAGAVISGQIAQDLRGGFTFTAPTLTVPVTGRYRIGVSVYGSGSDLNWINAGFNSTGTVASDANAMPTARLLRTATGVDMTSYTCNTVNLNQGDSLRFVANSGGGNPSFFGNTNAAQTYYHIEYIGPRQT